MTPEPKSLPIDQDESPEGEGLVSPPCSAFRFKFSATFPPDSTKGGGTFLEGDLDIDDIADLPEAALAIFKGAVADWDMEGQTHIAFSLQPNAPLSERKEAP